MLTQETPINENKKGCISPGFLVFLIILLLFLGYCWLLQLPALLNFIKRQTEESCVSVLREMAAAETAYYAGSGTFCDIDELRKRKLIDMKRFNKTGNYYTYESLVAAVSINLENKTFIIIAIPKEAKSNLRTFAIGQESKTMLWKGDDALFSKDELNLTDQNEWLQIETEWDIIRTQYGDLEDSPREDSPSE